MLNLYAVIGNPIAHSKSPFIHTEFSKQTGQHMHYKTMLASQDNFITAVESFRQLGGKGMNVTLPFKIEAHKISTQLTERATIAKAVNTLTFNDGEIYGDNTDGDGLLRDISSNLEFIIEAKRILLCGSGGAARGVVLALLRKNPCTLTVVNRTKKRSQEIQKQFFCYGDIVSCDYTDITGQEFDLIINATSASLENKLPPLPSGIFAKNSLAYDMMYGNKNTPFLEFAQQQEATYLANGIGMLVEQAAESFFVWHGIRPETKSLIEALSREI